MVEEWRPIEGHSLYDVSNLGRVRSWAGPGRTSRRDEPVLKKASSDATGRKVVGLARDTGGQKVRRVHQLVAEAFIGPRPAGAVVCHNDGDNTNNRVENLRYDSVLGNMHDKYRHGTHHIGSQNPCAKLNEASVREIRERYVARRVIPSNAEDLGREFGVAAVTIENIARGKAWAHV